MTTADHPNDPASFLAAAAALDTINNALAAARQPVGTPPPQSARTGPDQALAALLLLRQLREQLAAWEPGLIETARTSGASWADLAQPLGVASRQAAERRYLRVRPGAPGSTGEQRVQATRDRRAADRTVTAWARANAADLRRLAARITTLPHLPAITRDQLDQALAADDPATLITPLTAAHPHLRTHHPDIAATIDTLTQHVSTLRPDSGTSP
ncbi:type III effector protein [Streptomyces sp. NBC_01190]|uniref:type III effector protein n=1 Tax=Streptomyces sp. NBC_01190 TaxID=2903767 RepID=UPI003870A47F|nr:type III effector protein [Streptomyces sp. NBC_01190]